MKPTTLIGIAVPLFIAAAAPQPASAQEVVPLPRFNQIELNGGGDVVVRYGPVQRVTLLEGSTQFTRVRVTGEGRRRADRLVIHACNQRCPRNYDLRIEIVTPDLAAVAIKGGGAISFQRGFPVQPSMAAAVKGGGRIDMRALPAQTVAAAVEGGGNLHVNARRSLVAAVDGGGVIRYLGNPSVTTAINGGGVVTRGN